MKRTSILKGRIEIDENASSSHLRQSGVGSNRQSGVLSNKMSPKLGGELALTPEYSLLDALPRAPTRPRNSEYSPDLDTKKFKNGIHGGKSYKGPRA